MKTIATGSAGAIHAGRPAFSIMCVICVPNTFTNLNKQGQVILIILND